MLENTGGEVQQPWFSHRLSRTGDDAETAFSSEVSNHCRIPRLIRLAQPADWDWSTYGQQFTRTARDGLRQVKNARKAFSNREERASLVQLNGTDCQGTKAHDEIQ